jgi:2-C-methyl-D-erythritol 4-phosphate cytidylyltransferase
MTKSIPKIWAILPAAGAGKRFSTQKPKQFFELNGQLMAEYSLQRLLSVKSIQSIIVPCDSSIPLWSKVPSVQNPKVQMVAGGEQRANSVLNGLQAIADQASDSDWVLVHDIARPCITPQDINKLITAVEGHAVGGILTANVNETLKKVDLDQQIEATLDRAQYRLAQTPQLFKYSLLKTAIENCLQQGITPTDEAFAVENAGLTILAVEGRHDNIKITRKEDLAIASAILNSQES